MPNAHVNKVVYGSDTLIDLTSDTITAENVIEGYTFHAADGSTVEGALTHLTNAEIDEITGGGGGGGSDVTVQPLSVTSNGTYTAPSGTAYSPVTVNVPTPAPSLQSKSATPNTSQQTVTPDSGYDGLSSVTVGAIPSQYVVPNGNKAITENGTGIDVAGYETVSVDVPSPNVQVAQSTTRVANTAYTETASLICAKTGTYDVYWDCFRSTTSGTSGSRLYIDGTAYGSANTTFSNHAQNNHLTGVQLTAGQEVSVYVRSRATNYYAYCGQLTIVQTA